MALLCSLAFVLETEITERKWEEEAAMGFLGDDKVVISPLLPSSLSTLCDSTCEWWRGW